ncbi:MAG: cytochrome c1 [Bordetella sp.]|nr:MAG: cytochrome c1 [Bordetella sp.]
MKNLIIKVLTLILWYSSTISANETNFPIEKAPKRINDLISLQNGAKLFVNYCLNCHSADSMRYNKLREIGLTDEQIKKNLLFTGDKIGDLMHIAMLPKDSTEWFGTTPPDLSVIARAKSDNNGNTGIDYIYTYMRSFYRDVSKLTGWDNLIFPGVAMPHVLWNRQGPQELKIVRIINTDKEIWEKITTVFDSQGFSSSKNEFIQNFHGKEHFHAKFTPLNKKQSALYDNDIADLATFMSWMAEPIQLFRKRLGVFVLLFLSVFFIVIWRLNYSYWKHVR